MTRDLPHDTYCGAKTRAGTPCRRPAGWGTPHSGEGRCKLHGGKSAAGIASPRYKNGRHSKYMPARLLDRYTEALTDPDLLALDQEIALLDARLSDLLKRVDSGESGKIWTETLAAWQELTTAIRTQDRERQQELGQRLDTLIKRGHADYRAWGEVHSVLEQRRRLVESERKRLLEAQQYITAEQAMVLITALMGIIKDNVNDRKTLNKISGAVNALVTADAG